MKLPRATAASMVLAVVEERPRSRCKANTAYNATKAGELHLARGWALELGRSAIRVNCIAPGNVFEGSKIWNPEYVAKRRAEARHQARPGDPVLRRP